MQMMLGAAAIGIVSAVFDGTPVNLVASVAAWQRYYSCSPCGDQPNRRFHDNGRMAK